MRTTLEDNAHRLQQAADAYAKSMLRMVESWFDKLAYETCCGRAFALREALGLVPHLVGYTARIMAAHDSLISTLWRSSHQGRAEVARAVRRRRDELARLVGELRSITIVPT